MIHLLKKKSKTNFNRRRITLSKSLSSSFLDCLCSSSFKVLDVVFVNFEYFTCQFVIVDFDIFITFLKSMSDESLYAIC